MFIIIVIIVCIICCPCNISHVNQISTETSLLQVIHFDPAFSGMQDLDGYIRCPTYGGWRQKDGVP